MNKWGYYLEIRFKEKYNGRKIWYFNDCYLCDCVNTVFFDKEDAQSRIEDFYTYYQYPYLNGKNIESITLRKTRL